MASVDRGKVIYKEYCAQCQVHRQGRRSGCVRVGAETGDPCEHPVRKDAHRLSLQCHQSWWSGDGKIPSMPYWGLTIGQQGVADVMAYLKADLQGRSGWWRKGARQRWRSERRLPAAEKNGEGAGRLPVENQSVPELRRDDPGRENAFPADCSTGGLCDVSWRQGQWARVHGRGLDSAAQKLHLRLDDEGHPGWAAVLDHQERFARHGYDVICRPAG